MKRTIIYSAFAILTLLSCNKVNQSGEINNQIKANTNDPLNFKNGYSEVNGIKMYYEIYGKGKPLVLIHGGGSTIQSSFEKVIPQLSKNRKVIGVELQGHGRTSDRKTDFSFEQDADDIATLLKNLNIDNADFFGFSNGGTTALQIAIRHPEIIDKIILGSALSKRNGVPEEFWGFMKQARLENMPEQLKEAYNKMTIRFDKHWNTKGRQQRQ